MAKYDIMRAMVALGGDVRSVVYAGGTGDLTWPEMCILRVLHGEHAVTKMEVVSEADLDPTVERERLLLKYSAAYKENPDVRDIIGTRHGQGVSGRAPDYVPRFDDETETIVVTKKRAPKAKAEPKTSGLAAAFDPAP